MSSIIRIKRSSVAGNPSVLAAGELAYSALTDNGSNGGDRLYIGIGTETTGNAANHFVIGGKYFTDMLDHTRGTLTASSAIVVDSNSKIDNLKVDNLDLNGNTISSTDTNGDIVITPNGTGKLVLNNPYINGTTDTLAEFIYDTVGGAVTGGTGITVTNNDGANTSTISLANTAVTAGSYGSASQIPTFTVDAQGRLTAAGTADISTTLNIAGDTGTDSVALGTDTITFVGGTGITSAVTAVGTATSVTFDIDSTVATLTDSQTLTNKTISGATNTLSNIANSSLTNSSVTINGTTVSLGGTATVTADANTLTGTTLKSTVVTSSLTSVGTIGTGVWEATDIGVAHGGTGTSTGSITGTGALTFTAGGSNTNVNLVPNGTGIVDVGGKRVGNAANPTQSSDLATKAYVDSLSNGLDVKASVRAATTANITLSNTQTVDGVALSAGDRVLVKNQSTGSQNGIYVVASGAWTRATDFDNVPDIEVSPGTFFFVEEGTTQADNGYVVSNDGAITIGTTAITFSQFSGAGQITAGAGLTKTGNTLDVVGTTNRITVNTDSVDIASTYVGQSSITTLGTIGTGTWQGTIIGPTYGGTGINNGTKTITLGGSFTHTGAHTLGLTTTANTSVTLPTTGTLATLAGSESLSNKTITSSSFSGTTIAGSGLITFTNTTDATALGTAAVVLTGGLSVAKQIRVGTNITGAGAATSTLDGFNIDGGTY
jgi:hypothetical protein